MDEKDVLRHFIMSELKEPCLFNEMIGEWPAAAWDLNHLSDFLKNRQLGEIRIGPISSDCTVLWESDCIHEDATFPQFLAWTKGICDFDNPLRKYDNSQFWCYLDYKNMADLFSDRQNQSAILQSVRWDTFGFIGRNGEQSTIWVGSRGAHTPCHYDTYGCNLVAQIHGRKRWILFPPHQTKYMYLTRIPYEESSVFSRINVSNPNLQKFPLFKHTTPYVVTLEPGQVLYVPHHWWHYVESLENSISINTWIELDVDNIERIHEAVARTIVTSVADHVGTADEDCPGWLNPTECSTTHDMNMKFLNNSIKVAASSSPSLSPSHRYGSDCWQILSEGCAKYRTDNQYTKSPSKVRSDENKYQQNSGKNIEDIHRGISKETSDITWKSPHTKTGVGDVLRRTHDSSDCKTIMYKKQKKDDTEGLIHYSQESSCSDLSNIRSKLTIVKSVSFAKFLQIVNHMGSVDEITENDTEFEILNTPPCSERENLNTVSDEAENASFFKPGNDHSTSSQHEDVNCLDVKNLPRVTTEMVINCLAHPSVIAEAVSVLQERLKEESYNDT